MTWVKKHNKKEKGLKRTPRNTIDHDVAESVALRGYNRQELAKMLEISQHTASKIITKVNATQDELKTYRTKKGDVLTSMHLKTMEGIDESLSLMEGLIAKHKSGEDTLKATEIAFILRAQTMSLKEIHHQERLEEGKSTANVSRQWYSRVINSGDAGRKDMYKNKSEPEIIDVDNSIDKNDR